jgi:SAM-dependent methyltransferase
MSGYTGIANLEVMEEAVRYNRFLLDMILPLALERRRVLDFGAGTGTFACKLLAEGADICCVEPDPRLRLALQRKIPQTYGDLAELASESIDLAYSLNVLEHIEDDAAALSGLRRVLKPGGRLVLYVPAFMVLFSAMDRAIGHVRRYRKKALARLVESAGFAIDDVRYADSLGFLAALAFKAAGPRSGALSPRAVKFYDRWLFPVSRILDLGLAPIVGKNLVLRARRT